MTAVINLLQQAHKEGLRFVLRAPDTVKLVGKDPVVQRWTPVLRQHRPAIIEALTRAVYEADLVDELIETDGISLETAKTIAKSAAGPYPPEKWMAIIAELDRLIGEYCEIAGLDHDKVMAARRCQSLASIPEALSWFRDEVGRMRRSINGQS